MLRFLLLSLISLVRGAEGIPGMVDCTTMKTCSECYNASYFCHWCEDGPPGEERRLMGGESDRGDRKVASAAQNPLQLYMDRKTAREGRPPSVRGVDPPGKCSTVGTGCAVGATCGGSDVNATCAAQSDCQTCYNVSSLCHWCGSNGGSSTTPSETGLGCHPLGSVYGCGIGVSCNANTECRRPVPEFIGYGAAPLALDWTLLIVFLIVVGCAGCCQFFCFRIYKQVREARLDIEGETTENVDRRPALWARMTDRMVTACYKNSCKTGW